MLVQMMLAYMGVGVAWAAVLDSSPDNFVDPNPSYAVTWEVKNQPTYDEKSQQEALEDGTVEGRYSYLRPDGKRQTVIYRANDEIGFVVDVQVEDVMQPFGDAGRPASADATSSGRSLGSRSSSGVSRVGGKSVSSSLSSPSPSRGRAIASRGFPSSSTSGTGRASFNGINQVTASQNVRRPTPTAKVPPAAAQRTAKPVLQSSPVGRPSATSAAIRRASATYAAIRRASATSAAIRRASATSAAARRPSASSATARRPSASSAAARRSSATSAARDPSATSTAAPRPHFLKSKQAAPVDPSAVRSTSVSQRTSAQRRPVTPAVAQPTSARPSATRPAAPGGVSSPVILAQSGRRQPISKTRTTRPTPPPPSSTSTLPPPPPTTTTTPPRPPLRNTNPSLQSVGRGKSVGSAGRGTSGFGASTGVAHVSFSSPTHQYSYPLVVY